MKKEILKSQLIFFLGYPSAGKTTLLKSLAAQEDFIYYNIDWHLMGDSQSRLKWIESPKKTIQEYESCNNCLNWFDWENIENDLDYLLCGKKITIPYAYERDKNMFKHLCIEENNHKTIVVDGSMVTKSILLKFKDISKIIFLYSEEEDRFIRTIRRDKDRRTLKENLSRFLNAESSHDLYYQSISDLNMILINEKFDILDKKVLTNSKKYITIAL